MPSGEPGCGWSMSAMTRLLAERAVGADIKGAHMAVVGVVHVEDGLVRRKGQAVGPFEVVRQQLEFTGCRDAVDAVIGLFLFFRLDAIGRIGEVDDAI